MDEENKSLNNFFVPKKVLKLNKVKLSSFIKKQD